MPRTGLTTAIEYEWVLAAQWAGYRWHDFQELEGEEQSVIVAAYRCHTQMEAVVAHEQLKESQRAARRKSRRS